MLLVDANDNEMEGNDIIAEAEDVTSGTREAEDGGGTLPPSLPTSGGVLWSGCDVAVVGGRGWGVEGEFVVKEGEEREEEEGEGEDPMCTGSHFRFLGGGSRNIMRIFHLILHFCHSE